MLEPIKRVLVPLDGSRRAEGAIRYAKRIASATNGTVILLQVVEIPTQQADAQGYLDRVSAEYKLTEKSDELVSSQSKASMPSAQATRTVFGEKYAIPIPALVKPTEDIIIEWAEAEENKVDLIVLCRHGNNGSERPLGRVAQEIVLHRHPSKPILLVHEESPEFKRYDAHALVALDGSSFSETVLPPAAYLIDALGTPEKRERVRRQKGTLHFVQVVKDSPEPVVKVLDNPFEQEQEKYIDWPELDKAINYLRDMKKTFNDELGAVLVLQTDGYVVKGEDPAETLVKTAESGESTGVGGGYDFLALATHGKGGLLHSLHHKIVHRDLGGNAERVIAATKLPILIVRPHKLLIPEN